MKFQIPAEQEELQGVGHIHEDPSEDDDRTGEDEGALPPEVVAQDPRHQDPGDVRNVHDTH